MGEKRAKYGDGLIKEYSIKLTKEIGKGFSTRNLKRMRKFYLYIEKGTAVMAQLTWTHYIELLTLNNINEINYYIDKNVKQITQNKTIGIIICKKDNKFVMEYCSDNSIFKTTYKMI